MDLGLKGAKVIMTGGGKGIGRAALELFAAEGADVAFSARSPAVVEEVASALQRHGGKVHGAAFDMEAGADAYAEWLRQAVAALGGCDIFIPMISSSGAQSTTDWHKSFEYDVMGAVRGCEALEAELEKSDRAAVVLMSSTAAVETFIRPQGYNAVKASLVTYSGQLGQAWGAKGIRVNCVSPGPIEFEGGNWPRICELNPALYEATRAGFALGRFGAVEEVARAVVFLASPMSSFTTGVNLVVDGGFTKRVQF
ncbi:SDR family NAD(P)-dependent oxidoreductase [Aquisediminimonas sediminicola]|uniref:SDR family NAD(P)-dependent oxidoreductase n=1 Tax=Alteraquisediminimonas sediminicola TaxID=2676787 RepID=UPI001C8E20E3|nr:SDR family oxidoreductase [Aquisediminimonas sediminicola]